jgi:Glycoside-hydrolase family GH114
MTAMTILDADLVARRPDARRRERGQRRTVVPMLAGALLGLSACASAAAPAASAGAITRPPPNAPFDYQLGGAYPPAAEVRMLERDREAAPLKGRYNVCYVNGFQTQAQELGWWKRRHPGLLTRRHGRLVSDPGYPGEVLLDTSTAPKRAALARIVGVWIRGCAASGYQGVEFDNLDSWTRAKGTLTRAGNFAFARQLVIRGHAAGLAVAQKNTAEILPGARRSIGFDFAVVEECQAYHECDAFTRAYGARVYEVEYDDAGGLRGFEAACAARGSSTSIVFRDRGLVPAGTTGYHFRTC